MMNYKNFALIIPQKGNEELVKQLTRVMDNNTTTGNTLYVNSDKGLTNEQNLILTRALVQKLQRVLAELEIEASKS